ncbi:MAG: rod shape-determining protein MreC [Actinomycetales bacterium]|nr:rod shape-determining protein MreC [Actinomycetales bacterium]
MFSQRTRILLTALLVASLTFVILDLRGGRGPFASLQTLVSSTVGGLERAGATVVSPVTGVRQWWGTWGDQRERIARLEQENLALRSMVVRSAEDRARADALDSLLRVAGAGRYRIVPAEVIAIGPKQEFAWTVTIDAGSRDGIEKDMSVINGDGLVGRVQAVNRNSSTVVLLTDATVSVGARIAGSEEVGILSGTGRQDSLEFQVLDPLATLRQGDALVTFGSRGGRPYAPGIPIGQVVEVSGSAGQLARIATVRPFADVSTLTIVGVVVRPPREDPRDSVLPAREGQPGASGLPTLPTASPSATAESDAVPVTKEPTPTVTPQPSGGPTDGMAEPSGEPTSAPPQEAPASFVPNAGSVGPRPASCLPTSSRDPACG